MKRKHDLLKEKSKTRDAVGQISSWCLLIALHQRFGVGADRMERIAGDAEKLQKEIAAIIDEHGTAAGIAEMQRRLDGICLTEMRVPLNRNTKNRREVELRMAADQTVTAMWCCFALAIHQTLGFGRDRLTGCTRKLWRTTASSMSGMAAAAVMNSSTLLKGCAIAQSKHCGQRSSSYRKMTITTAEPACGNGSLRIPSRPVSTRPRSKPNAKPASTRLLPMSSQMPPASRQR